MSSIVQKSLKSNSLLPNLKKYNGRKMYSLKLADIYEYANRKQSVISDSRLSQLRACGDYLHFVTDGNTIRLKFGNFCHMRMCPICSHRKSLKLYAQMSQIMDKIESDDSGKDICWLFLTLTVENVKSDKLKDTLSDMIKAFNRMFTSGRTATFNKKLERVLLGYMRGIEVTYNNRKDTYHPHIHVLLAVDKNYFNNSKLYVKQSEYADMWKQSLKIDYIPVVSVQRITGKSHGTKQEICETAKYPVKLDTVLKIRDIETASNAVTVLHNALYRRRLIVFGGILKKVKAELKLQDIENVNLNDNIESFTPNSKIQEICYHWDYKTGAYFECK